MRSGLFPVLLWIILEILSVQGSPAQNVSYIKVPELEKILKNPENKLFVVNLWATWCAPCVKELPGFEKVARDYDPSKVKFILVSLDFPSEVQKQLLPFLKKNNISLDVNVMTDLDYNSWMAKVDPDWQGNIPSTLFFNNKKKTRYFHPGELSETELRKIINQYL
ncbi:MAG: TlpA disulfide reductase family protein [Bacteroidota bacterium]|nr:TlpA disulfide reductase family protein [Bacteroidota bacterium]